MFSRFLPHTRSHIQRPHTRTTVHIMGMGTRITIPRTIRTMGTDMDIVDIHTALVTDIAVIHIGTATATVIMVTAIMATEAMVSLRFIRDGTAVAAGGMDTPLRGDAPASLLSAALGTRAAPA